MRSRNLAIESTFGMICLLLLPVFAAATPCQDADLIVRGAHIVTMDPARPSISAMAIRDGRILAVGSEQELLECASNRTQVIDLHGKTVLPCKSIT